MKNIFILIIVLLLNSSAFSQKSLGGLGGVIMAKNFNLNDSSETTFLYSHFENIYFRQEISKSFSFQLGLNYFTKGFRVAVYLTDYNNEPIEGKHWQKYLFRYVEIPLLFSYKLSNFSIQSGLGFAHRIGAEIDYPLIVQGQKLPNGKVTINSLDISFLGGLEYTFPISDKVSIVINSLYFNGIGKVGIDFKNNFGFLSGTGINLRL